jgi:hypothetical protein
MRGATKWLEKTHRVNTRDHEAHPLVGHRDRGHRSDRDALVGAGLHQRTPARLGHAMDTVRHDVLPSLAVVVIVFAVIEGLRWFQGFESFFADIW